MGCQLSSVDCRLALATRSNRASGTRSGRIRNELQTLCSEAIKYLPNDRMVVDFDQVDDAVLPPDKKALIKDVLAWYKKNHPIWFQWLDSNG